MTKASTVFNKFVTSFIEKHCSEDILEVWENEAKDNFVKMVEKELKKTPKAKKEKKPADAPKAARSAYILFCMEERPKINKEFPELSNQDKVKLMAERWNEAKEDEDVMKRFKKLAEDDKKRAAKDKENYVPSADGSEDEKPKKKTKRTKSGYMLFCDNERGNVKSDGFTGKDITTELARRWKALKEDDEDMYSEYMEKASELKKKKSEESDDEEEEKPKKKAAPKKEAKKAVPKKKAAQKKKVVEESDSESDSSSDEE
jgi:hypothetical protein